MELKIRETFPLVPRRRRFLHMKSSVVGALAATIFGTAFTPRAEAIDFMGIANAASKLLTIKKNLDNDVKALTADAKVLFNDKDTLFQIKEQLVRLATETKTQIDQVQTLVGQVEGHIKTTQADIQKTSQHVQEIEEVRKALK